jgi:hypothetical protein
MKGAPAGGPAGAPIAYGVVVLSVKVSVLV